jgi:hypothetical protein
MRLRVDPQSKKLLNSKKMTGQKGFLVVEPMVKKVKQQDTIDEGVRTGFKQGMYKSSMHSKRVSVTGVYSQDMEHGWREIHPVTSIRLLQ